MRKISLLIGVLLVGCGDKQIGSSAETNSQMTDAEYSQQLDQLAQVAHEGQIEAEQARLSPPTYQKSSIEQTRDFLNRVETLRSEDSMINLANTPDVARHSRKYNALIDEAKHIYGEVDIANPLRYCTNVAEMGSHLWRLKYSPSNDVAFDKKSMNTYSEMFADAKKACIEDVQKI